MIEILNKIITDPTNHIPLYVLIIGLVSKYLKPFIKSQDFFEKEIQLMLSKIKEKICEEHFSLLQTTIHIENTDSAYTTLRGTPSNTKDLINNYTTSLFKNFERTLELKRALKKVRYIYNFLFGSIVVSFIVLVFNLIFEGNIIKFNVNEYVKFAMIALILGQLCGLFWLRKIDGRNKYFREEFLDPN